MTERILFQGFKDVDHDYTWEHSRWKQAVHLIDIDPNRFGCIISEGEGKEETSGTQLGLGDYNFNSELSCVIYSKENLEVLSKTEGGGMIELIREITERPKNADVSDITLHQSMVVTAGTVHIKEGDLVLLNK